MEAAFKAGKIVGAICDATAFLGINGFLNEKRHTSNAFDDLAAAARENYTGKENYVTEQAVRDENLITANGTGYLEFTREVLTAHNAYPADYIENNYQFFKLGLIEFIKLLEGST